MLAFRINVPTDQDLDTVVTRRALHEAHIKHVHLARPITFTAVPITSSVRQLATLLGLHDNLGDAYKIEAATTPCTHGK